MLSQRQFNKTDVAKKPGSSYGGYVRWVTRTRAQRAAGGGSGGVGALARGDVNAQVNAQLAGFRSATRYQQQQAQHQAARAQGFAKALAALTTPNAATAEKTYVDAANRLQGFGHGLTGDVLAAQQAEAARSASEVAQATGGQGRLVGYDPSNLRTVGQYGGVTLPAESLSAEAARAKIQAGRLRDANVAQVGTIAQQYLAKVTDLQNQLAAKRMEVEQTRPSLYRQALSARQEQARQAAQDLLQQQQWQADYNEKVREFNAEQRRLTTGAKTTSKYAPQIIGSSGSGYYMVDPNTGKMRRLIAPTGTGTTPGGLSTKDVSNIGSQVYAAFHGTPNPNYDARYDPNSPFYNKDLSNPSKDVYDKDYRARMHRYKTRPATAETTMRYLHSLYPKSYADIYRAMIKYAYQPNSPWAGIVNWQGRGMGGLRGTPGHVPPSGKKRRKKR